MKCLFCASTQSAVVDKREVKGTGEIRRRRKCLKCLRRFTTYERISSFDLYIVKKDGRREPFDRSKLKSGLEKALEKRPGLNEVEALVDKIVRRLRSKDKKDIESRVIGKTALLELKKLDPVAYLRFASVYRKFESPKDFTKELENLN